MDDTEKKVLKILATSIILFFAALLILYIMHEQSWTYNFHNELAMGYIFASSGSIALMQSFLLYLIYTPFQPDILAGILIVLIIGFQIMFGALVLYRDYLRYKRSKRSTAVKGTYKLFPALKQLKCLYCGSEISENTEFCPRCVLVFFDIHFRCFL